MFKKDSTKILIIEDHQEMVLVLSKFLSEQGFQIESAESGEDALKHIKKSKPDAILMDIMLPGISGIELTQKIRTNGFIDTYIPILMLTAKSEIKDVINGLEVGADDYIIKPFSFDELIARVNSALRFKRLNDNLVWQSKELESANQQIYQLNQTLLDKNKELRTRREVALLGFLGNKNEKFRELKRSNSTIESLEKLGIKREEFFRLMNSVRIDIKNAKWRKFIDSNSMDPLIDEGTTTIEIKPKYANEIKVGDIVAHSMDDNDDYAFVHRVVEIGNDENGIYFVTKGDNYWQEDPYKIRFSQIEGIVVGILY